MATDEVLAKVSEYSEQQKGGENYVMSNSLISTHRHILLGRTRWHGWLRHCSTSRKLTVSILDGVIRICHRVSHSDRVMALGSPQPLKK